MPAGRPIPMRIDDDVLDRLDAIVEEIRRRAAGVQVSRTEVMRAAMRRGVEALELDLELPPPKKKRQGAK